MYSDTIDCDIPNSVRNAWETYRLATACPTLRLFLGVPVKVITHGGSIMSSALLLERRGGILGQDGSEGILMSRISW